MKKYKYIKYAILIITVALTIITIIQPSVKADFNTGEFNIQASDQNAILTRFSGVIDVLSKIGSYASVILLIAVGIKFMTGSIEEKAEYKQRMSPYVLGAIFVFAISTIVNIIQTIAVDVSNSGDIDAMGGKIIRIISVIGSLTSVIILAVMGIKYMSGGIDEKTDFKKSMLPYVIGATVVFSASNLAGIIYRIAINLG